MDSIFPCVAPDGVPDRDYLATLTAKHYDKVVSKDSPDRCGIEGCASQAVPELSDFPVCSYHFEKIIKKHKAKATQRERDQLTRQKDGVAQVAARDEKRKEWLRAREQVYYVRTGQNTIKIGFSAHLLNRIQSYRLPLTALLATEPGGRTVERERHQQFAEYRYGPKREDFVDAAELMEHIQLMRETHDTVLTDNDLRHEQIIIPKLVATR